MAYLTNFSFEFFYKIFTKDASRPILYHGVKKSKMTKNSNQGGGGSCLNTEACPIVDTTCWCFFVFFFVCQHLLWQTSHDCQAWNVCRVQRVRSGDHRRLDHHRRHKRRVSAKHLRCVTSQEDAHDTIESVTCVTIL